MSTPSPDNWIDEELRRVPLPEGLLARLRATGELTDEDLDESLQQVPLPPGLMARLHNVVEDDALDGQLRDVPVPEELIGELLFIPLDERLRDVVVPADLLVELKRIPPRPRRWSASRLALAASLLLMISSGYLLAMTGLLLSAYNQLPEPYAVITLGDPPVELQSEALAPVALVVDESMLPPNGESPDALAELAVPPGRPIDTRPVTAQLASWLPPDYDLYDSILPIKYGLLGQRSETEDRVPDLDTVDLPAPRGIEVPAEAGFDRQFLVRERTHPVVSLEVADRFGVVEELRRSRLPLWTQTTSFELTRTLSAAGRLPGAHRLHVEDFLAAMEFHYADARPRELAIRAAAGPSVFRADDANLLQIGVQAGPIADVHGPTHLTLAVDISDSMRWGERLSMVRDALRKFVGQLSAEDRVTLVVFNESAYTLLEDLPAGESDVLHAALDALSPGGGSNVGAGLREAAVATVSQTALAMERRHLIVFTDSLPAMRADIFAALQQLLGDLDNDGVAIDIVGDPTARQSDAGLARLAAAAGSAVLVADDAAGLHERLVERIADTSPRMAEDAALQIDLNPESVRAYRLLGHEATIAGGTVTAPVPSSMMAGESATALLEIWLHPSGPQHVADVTVTWRDPMTGEAHARQQEVRRVQFVPSFREAPLSLQAAAIAAEAAEVLRGSPFASSRSRDLSRVLQQADDVNPRLARRPSFQRFVGVLQQVERARRYVSNE